MSVTYQDVAINLGRPISDPLEQAQVTQWIAACETVIRARLGDLAALDQDVLDLVVLESVTLRVQNPKSFQSESIDDYSYRLPSSIATAAHWITDDMWRLLDPDAGGGAFSARPSSTADCTQWPASLGEGTYGPGWR
jgi:hypothetical protein